MNNLYNLYVKNSASKANTYVTDNKTFRHYTESWQSRPKQQW